MRRHREALGGFDRRLNDVQRAVAVANTDLERARVGLPERSANRISELRSQIREIAHRFGPDLDKKHREAQEEFTSTQRRLRDSENCPASVADTGGGRFVSDAAGQEATVSDARRACDAARKTLDELTEQKRARDTEIAALRQEISKLESEIVAS